MSNDLNKIFIEKIPDQEKANELMAKLFTVTQPEVVFSPPVTAHEQTVITASEVTAGFGFGFGSGGGTAPNNNAEEDARAANFGGGGGGGRRRYCPGSPRGRCHHYSPRYPRRTHRRCDQNQHRLLHCLWRNRQYVVQNDPPKIKEEFLT
jgi:hypothetical protein